MNYSHYLNEFDPHAAHWLRSLMAAGLIPDGRVDERSIGDVAADDVRGPGQRHFFAGVGGWCEALRLAGWPEGRSVWTGSCPCQPFSSAGKRRGTGDARHLWPEFRRLVAECLPATVFGEQVASRDGRTWLAGVRADLEALGYAVGAADLCAAGVGAPHIRQRLYWVASRPVADAPRDDERRTGVGGASNRPVELPHRGHGATCGVAHADSSGARAGRRRDVGIEEGPRGDGRAEPAIGCGSGRLADAEGAGHAGREHAGTPVEKAGCRARLFGVGGHGATCGMGDPLGDDVGRVAGAALGAQSGRDRVREVDGAGGLQPGLPGTDGRLGHADGDGSFPRLAPAAAARFGGAAVADGRAGFWDAFELVPCTDGKARRTQPGVHPLAHGVPGRVGQLRGYGNAVVPQCAALFVKAYLEAEAEGGVTWA